MRRMMHEGNQKLKEKRKQTFLKTSSEGRQCAKQKRFEEELERERQTLQDEEKRFKIIVQDVFTAGLNSTLGINPNERGKALEERVDPLNGRKEEKENPELYLEQLRAKYRDLSEKVKQRKRLKMNGGRANGNQNLSGGVGRGERLNAAQKEKMRLLTTAAFDRGKGEDTFGARDEDWQLYKLMSKDNDDEDDGQDEDEAELTRISARLQDIDPNFVPKLDMGPLQSIFPVPRLRPHAAEDFQIVLGVERFRCPEILFQPNMIGIDQAGLDEMAGISIRRLHAKDVYLEERITNSILVTGGSSLFPGIDARLEAGIQKIRPFHSPIRVVRASDPILDAWRGAAACAAANGFLKQTFSRQDYHEKGEDWLRSYQMKYSCV
ncbi:Actin-related protein 5 [Asimina triloba]